VLTKEATKDLAYELGDVLWYISQSASQLGLTLEQIAELNIAKLYKRHFGGDIATPSATFTDNDFANYITNSETKVLKDLEVCWVENACEFNDYQTRQKFIRCVENTLKTLQLNNYKHDIVCDEQNNTPEIINEEKIALKLIFKSHSGYYERNYTLPDDFFKLQK